ncbi:MAG: endonuclease MutS2 [Victivallales bacterium]|nr:endonuclease MutS2 [Victivallales bacterium]
MNQHTYNVLEYPLLLEHIAGHAQSKLGMAVIKALRPQTELAAIQAKRGLYADMLALQESPQSLPGLHIEDISALLRMLAPEGAVAQGTELYTCKVALDIVHDVLKFTQREDTQEFKSIQRLCSGLSPCSQLRDDLARCLDTDGSVLDNATPKLHELRRSIISTEQRIQRSLETLVKSPELASPGQEKFVTMRNGRYVIPIRKDSHSGISGIVHDLSQSGQTLFVEPTSTLPMGNDLVRMRSEEKDEVRRILAALSAHVRRWSDAIRTNQQIITELDAAAAISRWAAANRCTLPRFTGVLELHQARHPLLLAQFRKNGKGEEVVPLDLQLNKDIRTLAITGSNTGGKTVILKTIGLISLIAQAGLPVPASPDSQFAIYEAIYADIGDEQSIEASLSTYSGHIANIAAILADTLANGNSLVLLDELGSGTDPLEGGAIACSVLAELAKRKALTIATTHLGMVKNFVHQQPHMLNAAVRFDLESLRPLYILDLGRPGASHAFHIAKRIGMPQSVLKFAEKMLTGEHLRLEDMLSRMEQDQKLLAEQARQVKQNNEELIAKRDELRKDLESLKKDRKKLVNDAYKEASAIVENTRKDMENLIRKIREQGRSTTGDQQKKLETEAIRDTLESKAKRLDNGLRVTSQRPQNPVDRKTLKLGQKVWVETLQTHGKITELNERHTIATVTVNGVAFTMKTSELQMNRESAEEKEQQEPVIKISLPVVSGKVNTEINLIGLRVDDAVQRLDTFISQSVMAHLDEVRIIHGFGTGRLRAGIHAWLKANPSVLSFHLGKDVNGSAGGGATIVMLRRG